MRFIKPNVYVVLTEYQLDQAIPVTCYYIAESVSKSSTVIFIEKSVSFLALITDKSSRKYISKFGTISKLSDTFYIYIPYPRLPFDRLFGILSLINQFKLYLEIKSLIRKFDLDYSNTYLLSFNYNSSLIINKLRKYMRSLYYILDDWKEFSFPLGSKKLVNKENIETTKAADLIVTVSEQLETDALSYNKNVKTIKNAVDCSKYFNLDNIELTDINTDLYPIVGFVGTLEAWVDLSLISFIANKLPDVTFLIIGPTYVDLSPIRHLSNVILLGSKPKQLVPYYIKKMHIGIIPFKINSLSKSVSPLKLYEYLAAGIPVVSTPMDGATGMEQYDVFVENTYDGFLNRIKIIITDYDIFKSRKDQRIGFAIENSWDQRSEDLINYISSTSIDQ